MKTMKLLKRALLAGVVALTLGLAMARPVSAAELGHSSHTVTPILFDGQETHG